MWSQWTLKTTTSILSFCLSWVEPLLELEKEKKKEKNKARSLVQTSLSVNCVDTSWLPAMWE